jgi:hypothetical protein
MTKVLSLLEKFVTIPHTQLPGAFMKPGLDEIPEPKEFVGSEYRKEGEPGFTDDRVRNTNDYVAYAPRKVVPDLDGGGILVSENYPQSMAKDLNPEIVEANVPRQARGIKADTLTRIHDAKRTFDIAVATFNDTLDDVPPPGELAAWDGKSNPTTTQPENPFNAKYPYNHVRETESGHLFEADDTPGSERIKESHRSGTYYEIFPDGSKVEKIVRDNFTLIVGNDRVNIQGSVIVTVEGDCNMYTKGNFTHQVNGDYNLMVKGTHTTQVGDDTTLDCHSDYYQYVGNAIDPSKAGKGRGNKGGSSKVAIANDYKLNVDGATIETYGNAKAFENNNTITTRNTILFGDLDEEIRGGGKAETVSGNSSEAIGGNHVMAVVGKSTETIDKDHNITVAGDKTQKVTGDYNTTSEGATEIKGSPIELNPPS